ncbi:uncharacterized protein K489DRAFT_161020 [Dissoconium aciculare CBS 342.82]|uniref:Uncharacterized protein n=1 Tax=Dissoconium aciculare CBS 342.82 TaxID=1314786 RepID=A0A6J3MBY8_9PEZI|nr:uncharacterized protein K489DRAFT_161020 [Dissoconium aciculare CBS 342.82]KAF1825536.1 hypothetical protein K489DRAFT_161020 [Dissoconium aciculare CBS 342.82]
MLVLRRWSGAAALVVIPGESPGDHTTRFRIDCATALQNDGNQRIRDLKINGNVRRQSIPQKDLATIPTTSPGVNVGVARAQKDEMIDMSCNLIGSGGRAATTGASDSGGDAGIRSVHGLLCTGAALKGSVWWAHSGCRLNSPS